MCRFFKLESGEGIFYTITKTWDESLAGTTQEESGVVDPVQ
jgi:hypothetical protein